MHQNYDKIFKENINKIGDSLLSKLCGISNVRMEEIDTTQPKTIERRVDFLRLGIDLISGLKKLYHAEFQSDVHLRMIQRELIYYALIFDKHEIPIEQYVIYLGTGNWTAPTSFDHGNITFKYNVICMNSIDYELFVNSDTPEEIILAILCNFKKENKTTVIRKIISCLERKTKNKRKLEKCIFQLEILSNLRNLQAEIITEINAMSIGYDVKKDLRYLQGEEQGIEQGELLRAKKIVIKLLGKGTYSLQEIADIAEVDIDFVILIMNGLNDKK